MWGTVITEASEMVYVSSTVDSDDLFDLPERMTRKIMVRTTHIRFKNQEEYVCTGSLTKEYERLGEVG